MRRYIPVAFVSETVGVRAFFLYSVCLGCGPSLKSLLRGLLRLDFVCRPDLGEARFLFLGGFFFAKKRNGPRLLGADRS